MPYKPEGNESYDIKRLWGQQKEILRLVASGLYTNKEVGDLVGVTPQTVSNIINSALGKQAMEILQGAADAELVDLNVKFKYLAHLAVGVQENILLDEGTSKELQNKISDKFLDRAGYTPVAKNLNMNLNAGLDKDDIDEIKKRAEDLNRIKVEREAV